MRRIKEVKPSEISNRSLRRYLGETKATTRRFLLRRAGVEAGLVEVEVGEKKFEVTKIVVVPRFRGTGVGKALLRFAEVEAKRRGHTAVSLRAQSMDPRAMTTTELETWYVRSGYEHIIGPGFLHALRKRL